MKSAVKLLSINLIFFVFLIEVSLRLGGLNWLRDLPDSEFSKHTRMQIEYLINNENLVPGANIKINHPFFGYGEPGGNGNISFETMENFEKLESGSNIVAVHGGSVANNHYLFHKLSDEAYLSDKLGRKIERSINFSAPAARQPRALNIAAIYGHAYNISINIEGRNEMIRPILGNFPPYFPNSGWLSNLYFGKVSDFEKVGALRAGILRYLNFKKSLVNWRGSNVAMMEAFNLMKEKWEKRKIIELAANLENLNGRSRFESNELYSTKARLQRWIRYSCIQQNIQASMGIHSFFVIQPKPQFFKKLNPEEDSFVKDDQYELRKNNYQPVVDLDFQSLKEAGMEVVNMLSVFEKEQRTTYADSCCHMTDLGRELFLGSVLKEVRRRLESRDKPSFCDLGKVNSVVGF